MELRHLRYFVALVEERQFVRAAGVLHVAQSALSAQIRDLERELGAELIVRDRRGVSPTPAGEVLLRHARSILDQAEHARAEITQLTGLVTGSLRIGTGSPSGPVALTATLVEFQRLHPLVELVVRDTTSEELLRWLDDGTVDVAIVSFTPAQLPSRLRGTLIAREPIIALVPAGHPLEERSRLSLGDLAEEPLIAFSRGSGMRDAVDGAFSQAGLPLPRITAETIDPLMILELVGHGLGVALAPESFGVLAGDDVRPIPLAGSRLTRPMTLAWARERRSLPALGAFLAIAPQTMSGLPATNK